MALRVEIMSNSNYELLKYRLQNSMNQKLCQKGWTLKTLSDKSGVPYETLKKLANAKVDNPSLQSVIKIAQAFGCSLDSLLTTESALINKLQSLSLRSRKFIEAIADFELALTVDDKTSSRCLLPVVVPTGTLKDGMIFDTLSTEYIDVTPYLCQFGPQIMCVLKVTTDSFSPIYLKGDLLLISRDKLPRYGTVCVFLHHNQLYIRKYIPGNPPTLEPVNRIGASLSMDDPDNWTLFGCVLTMIRQNRLSPGNPDK